MHAISAFFREFTEKHNKKDAKKKQVLKSKGRGHVYNLPIVEEVTSNLYEDTNVVSPARPRSQTEGKAKTPKEKSKSEVLQIAPANVPKRVNSSSNHEKHKLETSSDILYESTLLVKEPKTPPSQEKVKSPSKDKDKSSEDKQKRICKNKKKKLNRCRSLEVKKSPAEIVPETGSCATVPLPEVPNAVYENYGDTVSPDGSLGQSHSSPALARREEAAISVKQEPLTKSKSKSKLSKSRSKELQPKLSDSFVPHYVSLNSNSSISEAPNDVNDPKESKNPKNRVNALPQSPEEKPKLEKGSSKATSSPKLATGYSQLSVYLPTQVLNTESLLTRDWNSEFQQLVPNGFNFSLSSMNELRKLINDFIYCSQTYSKIIISEMCLPIEKKTIKPVNIGGFAGGEKYICQGILFKFALDKPLRSNSWMYGGDKPSTEKAMKAAGREVQAYNTVFMTKTGVRTPLMTLIDFKGYRVIASSMLPLAGNSIKYGSADGGRTVHNDDPELNKIMVQFGKAANLQPHRVANSSFEIVGPGDMEVHIGTDGNYYVLDPARLYPAEALIGLDELTARDRRKVYYNFLRAELVRSNPVPLSSDAFTRWGRGDKLSKQYEQDVVDATHRLYTEVIPRAGHELDMKIFHMFHKSDCTFFSPVLLKKQCQKMMDCFTDEVQIRWENDAKLDFRHVDQISQTINSLHSEGINIRHIGRVRSYTNTRVGRKLLMSIALSRVIKNKILKMMRQKMEEIGTPTDEPFKDIIVRLLNDYAFPEDVNPNPGHERILTNQYLKKKLHRKFKDIFTIAEENDPELDLKGDEMSDFAFVISEVIKLLGIKVSKKRLNLFMSKRGTPLLDFYIKNIQGRVRIPSALSFALAVCQYGDALGIRVNNALLPSEAENSHLINLKIDLLNWAYKSAEASLSSTPGCPLLSKLMGDSLMELYRLKRNEDYLEEAFQRFEFSSNINPTVSCYTSWIEGLELQALHREQSGDYEIAATLKQLRDIKVRQLNELASLCIVEKNGCDAILSRLKEEALNCHTSNENSWAWLYHRD